jgi:BirA family biotin operon repressor/biotin-[acetyl-CoA-carboxylase] ligase
LDRLYLEEIDSTHRYIIEQIKAEEIDRSLAVIAKRQTAGQGSRGSEWRGEEGNLYLSFCLSLKDLPVDLPLASASIYFAYILKTVLKEQGSKVWIKWPNDFYIKAKKSGGLISTIVKDFLIVSIGLNSASAPNGFAKLDIDVDMEHVLKLYFAKLDEKISWKQIFSKFSVEFDKNRSFCFNHRGSGELSLEKAILHNDGSLEVEGERIFSRR